jgi:hypothetical protein
MRGRRLAAVLAGLAATSVAASVAVAAQNPVVAALENTNRATSSVGRVSAVVTASGSTTLTMAGRVEQAGRSAHMNMTLSAGGRTFAMEGILDAAHGGVVMYLRSPLFDPQLPAGKKWLRIDMQREGAKLGVDFSSLIGTSTQQSSRILALGLTRTTRLGAERVAGRTTSHYRAVVDYDRAASRAESLAPAIAKLEQLAGVRSLRIAQDIWVGPDGRVWQQRATMPMLANGVHTRMTQTLTVVAFDVPVRITPPPANLIYSA